MTTDTSVLHRLANHQVTRFLILGGTAAAINWLVRFPLSMVMPLPAAVMVAYIIGMSAGFYFYSNWVFPGSKRSMLSQSLVFLAVNAVGAVVVLAFTYGLLEAQRAVTYSEVIKEGLAHGFAIGIGAVVNFFGHKLVTFSTGRSAD